MAFETEDEALVFDISFVLLRSQLQPKRYGDREQSSKIVAQQIVEHPRRSLWEIRKLPPVSPGGFPRIATARAPTRQDKRDLKKAIMHYLTDG